MDRYLLEERVELFRSDLFDDLPAARYDLIVSNPPYVSSEEMQTLPDEYGHEPALGLEAGSDGMDIVARILCEGAHWLRPGGIMIVEVGDSMGHLVARYPRVPFLWLEFERGGTVSSCSPPNSFNSTNPSFLRSANHESASCEECR